MLHLLFQSHATTVPGVPVRIAGNILQLGNTFADLQGGVSTNTDRMPIMNLQADGRYSVTLGLPAGAHIQYKYTLGDGFWNAEHKADGQWNLREFVVPAQDTTIQDSVATWSAGDSAPILFEVSVPSVTPPGDIIYMQFNTFGWMEPIPMWPLGNNRWAYKLYSPLNILGSFSYRYCRNGQCGSADDVQTIGASPTGRQAITSLIGQDIQDTVSAWKWFENPSRSHWLAQALHRAQADLSPVLNSNPLIGQTGHIMRRRHLQTHKHSGPTSPSSHQAGRTQISPLCALRPFPDRTHCGSTRPS